MKRFLKLFKRKSQSIKHATALLAITALLSNILGLGRNLVFYRFIKPELLDVYFASFRVPDLIFNLLIFGAITSAFIPTVSALLSEKKDEEAWKVTNQLLSWITVFFVALILILSLAMPLIITKMVPGFDQVRIDMTVFISRIILWQTLFFAWSFIIGGLLNGYQRFTTYSLAPLVYNLSLIIGGFVAAKKGLSYLAFSVIIGAIFHLLVQYKEVIQTGYRPKWLLQFSKEVKDVFYLMAPRSISQGMTQIVLVYYTSLASQLSPGSLAIFSGINDLQTTPSVIVANSLATACFPALSMAVASSNWTKLSNLLNKTIRSALFILIPTTFMIYILRAQIVRLYVGIGGVSWDLTHAGIVTIAWFAVGIIPGALATILSKVFYASKNSKTPMYIGIVSGLLAIVGAQIAFYKYQKGIASLAIGEVVLFTTQAVMYITILHKSHKVRFHYMDIVGSITKYGLGAFLAALSTWASLHLIDNIYRLTAYIGTDTIIGLFIQAAFAGLIGIIVYSLYSYLSCKEELNWLVFKRKKNSEA